MHTSHVTLDNDVLLNAMIKKKSVDAGWIIFNNMIYKVRPSKALWFPTITIELCMEARVKTSKNEERIKLGMAISVKVLDELPQFRQHMFATEILGVIKNVREQQKKCSPLHNINTSGTKQC